jgi:flagellar hook-associated protein 2
MIRPSNTITDIIPGVTLTLRNVSERPVTLDVSTDREGVKDAIFNLVGNYNLLMAELNVLTRTDPRILDELTYFSREEIEEMRRRLGAFSGDSTLNQLRNNLQRAVSSPYPTDEGRDLALLAQIGISTNARGSSGTGINPSQLRGYLDIDERVLDTALDRNLLAVRQLFGSDTTGDLIIDTGAAFNLDALTRPFLETGGIISIKTRSIDSQISQDRRRIDTLDRQLAAREAELRLQYSRMESAYARMEQMQSTFDNFNQQNRNR